VERFGLDLPILILTHNDADGLAAAALLARAFHRAGNETHVRILGRGENPWTEEIRNEVAAIAKAGLIVTDLGVRADAIDAETLTVFIDHHVPQGAPDGATVISGYGEKPTPTSSLLAWRCASALAEVDDLLWLAALGIIGDLGGNASFDELAAAKRRYGATALQEATSLVNAPRRASAGDARLAFDLLMKARSPRDVISGDHPETATLRSAREEVNAALKVAKRVAPRIRNGVALILFASPCQLHPLVAQAWRGRLKDQIVIAANSGYRPGWVHFSARSARGINLLEFLREKAPVGADENYGSGHEQATGGALRPDAWSEFVGKLGFGPEARVQS
jgi:single-stranded-DNA-specific exonuclease